MKKIKNAFFFALHGLKYAFVNERNFRIEIFFALSACITAYALHIPTVEWLVVIINIAFVISAELLNTAIEKLCDVAWKEIHPAIKIIKDVAAAAVLVASITAFICALIVFVPAFFKIVNQ